MNKEERIKICMRAIMNEWEGNFIWDNSNIMTKKQVKQDIKELNKLCSVWHHLQKQLIKLTGEVFVSKPKKVILKDFEWYQNNKVEE